MMILRYNKYFTCNLKITIYEFIDPVINQADLKLDLTAFFRNY